jgi:hypothetical protein
MERRGEARSGVKYILERLPAGYTLWQRPRPSDPKMQDKYLYGNPNSKPFDSPNRFYPHFEYLMENSGNNIGCPCTVCCGASGILPKPSPNGSRKRSSSAISSHRSTPKGLASRKAHTIEVSRVPRPHTSFAPPPGLVTQSKGRPKTISAGLDTSSVDEEGTPDVYRNLLDKLRRFERIDEVIEEPLSADWRAEQEFLPKLLENFKAQDQWIPRNGDIILYLREMPDGVDLVRHDVTEELVLYDQDEEEFLCSPEWEAGLVTEVATGTVTMSDLVEDSNQNIIYSGVRVEPLPDPNNPNKSLSKRHKYVSLRQTRPFVLWKALLQNSKKEDWHPTIKNALTLASTVSLMGKHRLRGTWPNASVYCHGIYIGSEMMAIGDTVRLLPNSRSNQTICTDVMVIKSIRLKWENLDKASNNDYDEGRPYNSEMWIYGSAYTSDASRSDKQWLGESNVLPPKAAGAYSEWHPLHPPEKELAVPYSRVLGRLYERGAMAYFLASDAEDLPGLDVGRQGVSEARAYSRKHDQRIVQEPNATWYWGDHRAEALNLQTVNGLEVAKYDQERDVKEWRKKIKLIEAMTNEEPVKSAARPMKDLRGFMAPSMDVLPVRTNGSRAPSSSAATSSNADGPVTGQRRSHIVDLGSDEYDEKIRGQTQIVEEDQGMLRKKAKVMVVID